jgi:hypothetical protein
VQGKGKVYPIQATKGLEGGRGIALLFHDLGARRGWVVSTTPRPLYPPGKIRYRLYRRLGGPQGRSGLVQKISPHRVSIPGPSCPLYRLSYPAPSSCKAAEYYLQFCQLILLYLPHEAYLFIIFTACFIIRHTCFQ